MDLGVLLESPQESQSSSPVGACTCVFHPSCSSSVTLPFAWIKGSGAFPRGFPKRLSHESFPQGCPTCHRGVSRSSVRKSRQCRENRIPWNGLRHLGDSGNGARPWSSSRLSCGERLFLRCDGTPGILCRACRERIPPLEPGCGNGAPLDVAGLSGFLSSGDGHVGELVEMQQGCEITFGISRG